MSAKKVVVKAVEGNTFSAYYKAVEILKDEGFAIGSMCSSEPIGFAPEVTTLYIAKWRNLNEEDKKLLSGMMTSKDWRNGDVTIEYFY